MRKVKVKKTHTLEVSEEELIVIFCSVAENTGAKLKEAINTTFNTTFPLQTSEEISEVSNEIYNTLSAVVDYLRK